MNRKGFGPRSTIKSNRPRMPHTTNCSHANSTYGHSERDIHFPVVTTAVLGAQLLRLIKIPSAPSCHRKRQAHNNLLRLHEPTHRRHIHPYAGSANHSENEYWVRPPRHTPGLSRRWNHNGHSMFIVCRIGIFEQSLFIYLYGEFICTRRHICDVDPLTPNSLP